MSQRHLLCPNTEEPSNWLVCYQRRDEAGVCTMQMDEGMDTGDVLLSQATPISWKPRLEICGINSLILVLI